MSHTDFSDLQALDDLESAAATAVHETTARIAEKTYFERSAAAPAQRDYRPAASATDTRPRATCGKCGGSGNVRWGRCFQCNGTGKGKLLDDKSVKARASSAKRRESAAAANVAAANEWAQANPERMAWLHAATNRGFEFAGSLLIALNKYGSLTENQIAALDRCVVKDSERKAARAVEQAARTVTVTGAGMDKLIAMFTRALEGGLKRPALAIGEIKLNPAKPTGRNPGAIYVKLNGIYQGKIADGRFLPLREADPTIVARVTAIAADPLAAAVLSGKETGRCSCCSRLLTDANSVAAGIGPICAAKFFG